MPNQQFLFLVEFCMFCIARRNWFPSTSLSDWKRLDWTFFFQFLLKIILVHLNHISGNVTHICALCKFCSIWVTCWINIIHRPGDSVIKLRWIDLPSNLCDRPRWNQIGLHRNEPNEMLTIHRFILTGLLFFFFFFLSWILKRVVTCSFLVISFFFLFFFLSLPLFGRLDNL